jgi:cellulose synthase/poly-beta-1,6-N-acetylglucosamine synthase-like glycosyltransferase
MIPTADHPGHAKPLSGSHEGGLVPDAPGTTLLSILIPLYNEEEFIQTVLERVLAARLPRTAHELDREVIIVDDASTDGLAYR